MGFPKNTGREVLKSQKGIPALRVGKTPQRVSLLVPPFPAFEETHIFAAVGRAWGFSPSGLKNETGFGPGERSRSLWLLKWRCVVSFRECGCDLWPRAAKNGVFSWLFKSGRGVPRPENKPPPRKNPVPRMWKVNYAHFVKTYFKTKYYQTFYNPFHE